MKLTRKQAIEKSIELWAWLAKTGKTKDDYDWQGERPVFGCYLCHYTMPRAKCADCPYYQQFGTICDPFDTMTTYSYWCVARTDKDRKQYARLFLAQLKELK